MIKKTDKNDPVLNTLLELDGEIFPRDDGYWTKFEVRRVEPNKHIPHGIRYSLTLHDKNNNRILGYDNAHGIKEPRKKKFSGKRIVWDHKHNENKIYPYEFENAYNLLDDFWRDVDKLTSK